MFLTLPLMNKKIIFKKILKHSYFIWLILLIIITVFVTYFYDLNKKNQINKLNKFLNNIYLKNSLKSITDSLEPRYISIEYQVKEGDTFEKIINDINISKMEREKILDSVSKNKNTKILKLNQKIYFKIDNNNEKKNYKFHCRN